MTDAYIYDAIRTPRGKGRKDGCLHEVSAPRLSAIALNALKSRNDLQGHAVKDVIWAMSRKSANRGPAWRAPPFWPPISTRAFRAFQ